MCLFHVIVVDTHFAARLCASCATMIVQLHVPVGSHVVVWFSDDSPDVLRSV